MTDPTAAPLALVTGASSGIGRALARQLAERGHDVVLAAEDAAIHEAAAEVAATGRGAVPVQVDLATAAGVEALYAATAGRPVDVLALNAGVGVGGRFWETELEDDLRLVDLNVRSVVHLAKLVVRDMVARGAGRVLVTASIAANAPGPYHATYAASKAYDHSFAEALRVELKEAGTGVTVTSLQPGPTDTEFFDRAGMADTKVGQGRKDDPDGVAEDGLDALFAGKDHVVAGSVKNKVMAAASSLQPDAAAAKGMSGMAEPGSGE